MALFTANIYQVKMEILSKAEGGSVYIAHLKLKERHDNHCEAL